MNMKMEIQNTYKLTILKRLYDLTDGKWKVKNIQIMLNGWKQLSLYLSDEQKFSDYYYSQPKMHMALIN